ncbi:MAG: helix-turn-helix transcriptional regulator [Desulfobacterales bacterium]|nr:helix-turn-helix transcriptional regulator [Desulfobacterales bacterium]
MVSEIKIKRIKQEISQVELGARTGIPQWRISLIERGIRPKKHEIEKISEALRLSAEDIFPDFKKRYEV